MQPTQPNNNVMYQSLNQQPPQNPQQVNRFIQLHNSQNVANNNNNTSNTQSNICYHTQPSNYGYMTQIPSNYSKTAPVSYSNIPTQVSTQSIGVTYQNTNQQQSLQAQQYYLQATPQQQQDRKSVV